MIGMTYRVSSNNCKINVSEFSQVKPGTIVGSSRVLKAFNFDKESIRKSLDEINRYLDDNHRSILGIAELNFLKTALKNNKKGTCLLTDMGWLIVPESKFGENRTNLFVVAKTLENNDKGDDEDGE